MSRTPGPELAPDDVPHDDHHILPFRRGPRRGARSSRSEFAALHDKIDALTQEQGRLRRTVSRLKRSSGTSAVQQVEASTTEAAAVPAVEGPKTLQELTALIEAIRGKRMSEAYSSQDAAEVDELYTKLAATTLSGTDYKVTRPVADLLDRLEKSEVHNMSHKPERLTAITAAKNQLRPTLPLRFDELTATVSSIQELKRREDELFQSKPLPKFDGAVDRQLMDAYTLLGNTPYTCTPAQAAKIRTDLKALYDREQTRWEHKYTTGSRWNPFSGPTSEDTEAQHILNDRKVMYHKRTLLLMDAIRKTNDISASTSMFWRVLGRGNEHLAA